MIDDLKVGKVYRVVSVGDGGGAHNFLFKGGLSFRRIQEGEVVVVVSNPSVERLPKPVEASIRKNFCDVLASDGQIYAVWFPKSKKSGSEKYITVFEEIE